MPYQAFRSRNFTLLWSGVVVSNIGTWMQNVAQSWLIYKMTGDDPLYLGWLGLAFAVPMVLVPPLGGAIADRTDRVRLLYFTQSGALGLAALLAGLTWTGSVRPGHLLATTLVGALLLAFDNPARQTLIADLVPRESLQNALSLNSATFTGAALIGPALAGGLLDIVGPGWLFMLNALSFLAVIFALAAMRGVPTEARSSGRLRTALLEGFGYVRRTRWLRSLLLLSALAAVFARSYQQLLPVFADAVFRVGARGYGMLLAAGGGGALLAALAMSSVRDVRDKERIMVASGLLMCAALFAFTLTRTFPLGVGLVVVVGATATVFTTMTATMIQLRVPRALRGRIISLYVSTLIGLPSLGALVVAALAASLGEPGHGAAVPLASVLARLGFRRAGSDVGPAAGAPRAVAAGALVLTVVLLGSLLRTRRSEADTEI